MAGRKSQFEEIQIKDRYSALSPKYFKILDKRLDSTIRKEQDWAVEQLTKAYSRMIPQNLDVTSNGRTIGQLIDDLHGADNLTKGKTSK